MSETRSLEKGMRIVQDTLWEELSAPDLRGTVDMPWLIVQGEADLVTPVSSARQLASALSSSCSEMIGIPGMRHLVEFAAPGKFLEVLFNRVLGIEGQSANRNPDSIQKNTFQKI